MKAFLRKLYDNKGKTNTFPQDGSRGVSGIEIAIFFMASRSRIPHFHCLRGFLEVHINDFHFELSSVDLIRENQDQ